MALNKNADLESRVKGSYDSGELDNFLDRANRKMHGRVGKHVKHDEVAKDTGQTVFDVPVEQLLEVTRVEYQGETLESNEYSVDLDAGEVTLTSDFDGSVDRGEVLRIYFKPTLFKDLEMEYAVKFAWKQRYRNTGNDTAKASVEDADDMIQTYVSDILSLNSSMTSFDHSGAGRPTGRGV